MISIKDSVVPNHAVAVDGLRHEKDRRRNTELPENRKSMRVVVPIAVVKGYRDCISWHVARGQHAEGLHIEAASQQVHLPSKQARRRATEKRMAAIVHPVVA